MVHRHRRHRPHNKRARQAHLPRWKVADNLWSGPRRVGPPCDCEWAALLPALFSFRWPGLVNSRVSTLLAKNPKSLHIFPGYENQNSMFAALCTSMYFWCKWMLQLVNKQVIDHMEGGKNPFFEFSLLTKIAHEHN
jgi:hypothetical protein